jgi:hypothetical protein
MTHTLSPSQSKKKAPSFQQLWQSIGDVMTDMPPLESRGNRPLQMTFEQQLQSLIYFHLQEHESAGYLLQDLAEDDFARKYIAPPQGIKKSSYNADAE